MGLDGTKGRHSGRSALDSWSKKWVLSKDSCTEASVAAPQMPTATESEEGAGSELKGGCL